MGGWSAVSEGWSPPEDEELIERVPLFTVGEGRCAVTFWSALVSGSQELRERSPADCKERMSVLCSSSLLTSTVSHGTEPPVLDCWMWCADGRLAGQINGHSVWVNVAVESRIAGGVPGYIETAGGRVFELGESQSGIYSATAFPAAPLTRFSPPPSKIIPLPSTVPRVVTMGLGVFVSLGCIIGALFSDGHNSGPEFSSAPLVVASVTTTPRYTSPGLSPVPLTASKSLEAPVSREFSAPVEAPRTQINNLVPPLRIPLTVSEQRARQMLRVEGDRQCGKKLVTTADSEPQVQLRDRLAADEARLARLTTLARLYDADHSEPEYAMEYIMDMSADRQAHSPEGRRVNLRNIDTPPAESWTGQYFQDPTLGSSTLVEQIAKVATWTHDLTAEVERSASNEGPGSSALNLDLAWSKQILSELRRTELQLSGSSPPVEMGRWEINQAAQVEYI